MIPELLNIRNTVALNLEQVPERVNEAVAAAAAGAGVTVLQDVGGEDRPISDALLPLLSYLLPNQAQLLLSTYLLTTMILPNQAQLLISTYLLTTAQPGPVTT